MSKSKNQKAKEDNQKERILYSVEWLLSEYDWVSYSQTKREFMEKLKQMIEHERGY